MCVVALGSLLLGDDDSGSDGGDDSADHQDDHSDRNWASLIDTCIIDPFALINSLASELGKAS